MDIGSGAIARGCFQCGQADWTDAFLAAFAEYAHRLGVKIDIGHIEPSQFTQSQTAAVE
jgi:hypothetical protein